MRARTLSVAMWISQGAAWLYFLACALMSASS